MEIRTTTGARRPGVACCDVVNRGVAYTDGKIFYNTLDNHTVAVDANTGREVWKTKVGDINRGESMTMARLVVKDKVLVGNSGGEFGVRGWLTALNIANGESPGAPIALARTRTCSLARTSNLSMSKIGAKIWV
jgi:glucose dehydrogenase